MIRKKLVLFGVVFFSLLAVFFLKKSHSVNYVVFFAPALHPAMTEIEEGVRQMLKGAGSSYELIVYNALGDQMLLKAQAEEIVRKGYALVIPVGATCSKTMMEVVKRHQSSMPVVFTAVSDPDALGITQARNDGLGITGVLTPDVVEDQFKELMRIKPQTKKVLLVYDPTQKCGLLKKAYREIQDILTQYRVILLAAEVNHATDIMQKVPSYLTDNVDVILVLKDHTVVAGIDALIKLAEQHGVTLYASDLDSGKKGAALSYGVPEKDLGIQAASMALQVLTYGYAPGAMPFEEVAGQHLEINEKTAKAQGLLLPEKG